MALSRKLTRRKNLKKISRKINYTRNYTRKNKRNYTRNRKRPMRGGRRRHSGNRIVKQTARHNIWSMIGLKNKWIIPYDISKHEYDLTNVPTLVHVDGTGIVSAVEEDGYDPDNTRHFILQGLREIEPTATGESTPYMDGMINDGEDTSYNVLDHYLFLEESELQHNTSIFQKNYESPGSSALAKKLGKMPERLVKVGAAAGAGVGVTKLATMAAPILSTVPSLVTAAGTAQGISAVPSLVIGSVGAAAGAVAAGAVVTGLRGLSQIVSPSIFGKNKFGKRIFTLEDTWNIIGGQLQDIIKNHKQSDIQPDIQSAILFGHHKSFASLLNLKKCTVTDKATGHDQVKTRKIGIMNNAMVTLSQRADQIDINVVNPDHKFPGMKSNYDYLQDNNSLRWTDDNTPLKHIRRLMLVNGIKHLTFYRHGTAIHNLFGGFNSLQKPYMKVQHSKEIRNARLLPSDMVKGGVIYEQGRKLRSFLNSKGVNERQILWCCSDLMRTLQTLVTCRWGYEQASTTPNRLIISRNKCIKHSLDLRVFFNKIYGQAREHGRKDLERVLTPTINLLEGGRHERYNRMMIRRELQGKDTDDLRKVLRKLGLDTLNTKAWQMSGAIQDMLVEQIINHKYPPINMSGILTTPWENIEELRTAATPSPPPYPRSPHFKEDPMDPSWGTGGQYPRSRIGPGTSNEGLDKNNTQLNTTLEVGAPRPPPFNVGEESLEVGAPPSRMIVPEPPVADVSVEVGQRAPEELPRWTGSSRILRKTGPSPASTIEYANSEMMKGTDLRDQGDIKGSLAHFEQAERTYRRVFNTVVDEKAQAGVEAAQAAQKHLW